MRTTMKSLANVVERLRQMPRLARAIKESRGLINTTDLLVATAATVVLASAVGGAAIGTLNESKYGKAQPDAQAIAGAISAFYKDTGKWPGQADQVVVSATTGGVTTHTASPLFLVTTTVAAGGTHPLPADFGGATAELGSTALSTTAAVCQNNSLEGFVGVTISAGTVSSATKANINDYLVRKPDATLYQNWKGPYLQADIKTDPWDRDWVLNLQPLYCSEAINGVTAADNAGALGYAWLLSGGSNRTVSTAFGAANVDPSGDDAGMNMGKAVKRGAGGGDK